MKTYKSEKGTMEFKHGNMKYADIEKVTISYIAHMNVKFIESCDKYDLPNGYIFKYDPTGEFLEF